VIVMDYTNEGWECSGWEWTDGEGNEWPFNP
jgi:hypothetical protein